MPIRARCIGRMIPLAVFGAQLWWLTGRFFWVTKTETFWSWIMARTNPRSNWLAWGLPSTVHRFLQTERCTSRPKPTCTPSASDDERLRVFSRQKFSLASLRLDVSWPPRFLVVGRQFPHSGISSNRLGLSRPFLHSLRRTRLACDKESVAFGLGSVCRGGD